MEIGFSATPFADAGHAQNVRSK